MIRILISACLLGAKVRYNGADATAASPIIAKWQAEYRLVPFCPEVAGGLGVPRPAAEIQGGGGAAVLNGAGRIVTATGIDVTNAFLDGARQALETARLEDIRLAVLKDGSPSCGTSFIYDGSFTRSRRPDRGVTAALLGREGIRVFSEQQIDEAAEYLDQLERDARCGE